MNVKMDPRISVLLVDDHTVFREATAELVNHQPDMEVVGQVGTGEEAISLAKNQLPDVIVLDIAMPRGNGLAVTKEIVKTCPNTNILILSAHQDSDHVISLLEAGALSYLSKTSSLNDLLDAIRATANGESVLPPSIASIVVKHISGEDTTKGEILTPREMEVLKLVAEGLTNEQVGLKLHLSTRTIEAHLTHIYTKLDVSSRTEAALTAHKRGWINRGGDS
jgi:NarL family two-component system response regulator LiaR